MLGNNIITTNGQTHFHWTEPTVTLLVTHRFPLHPHTYAHCFASGTSASACCLFIAPCEPKGDWNQLFNQGSRRKGWELSSDTKSTFKQRNNLGPPGKQGFSQWGAVLHRHSVCIRVRQPRHFPWKLNNTISSCNPLVSNPTAIVIQ